MGTKSIMVCDYCGLEATKAGCGEGDVVNTELKVQIPFLGKTYYRADLCSACREDLQVFVTKMFGSAS